MTYIYALFYCFTNVDAPCVMIGHEFDDPAPCIEMKNLYENGKLETLELTSKTGIKYICMKQSVPSANRAPQTARPEG
jgi:hypothetical protein